MHKIFVNNHHHNSNNRLPARRNQILQSRSGRNIRLTSGKASDNNARAIFNATAAPASARQKTIIDHNDAADEPLRTAHITNGQPITTAAGQQLCQCIQWFAARRRRISQFAQAALFAKNEAEVLLAFYSHPEITLSCQLLCLFVSQFMLSLLMLLHFMVFNFFPMIPAVARNRLSPLCLSFFFNLCKLLLYSFAIIIKAYLLDNVINEFFFLIVPISIPRRNFIMFHHMTSISF